jgi:hypothetical protein
VTDQDRIHRLCDICGVTGAFMIKASDSVWSPISPIVKYYVPVAREQGGIFLQ